ncbi:DUF1054 domain-containing protein [Guptibacillus algicola]|uniref:DUF1054 domain-containing protein n=1 Tax=Guptibacillus algicola TaxID=225844 RepID=UPI001CD4C4A1|nr:DUF1054 domain-containing protein [Alkalihalobacillus algicola]MCA0987915.1 DUF1054 domain-containing protein [Alkalihalobacillus algicola]
MSFKGFSTKDFETFDIDGLEPRMEAIQTRIQPKFEEISNEIKSDLEVLVGNEMYLHIARHLRRTKNPPADTWMAFSHNNRGYKKHPHFQIGLFDDHVFVWLAYIYELPGKKDMASMMLSNIGQLKETIPASYMVSTDHTKKSASKSIHDVNLEDALTRFRDVKKGEFLIGRHFKSDDPLLADGEAFIQEVKNTFETLVPIYHMSMKEEITKEG